VTERIAEDASTGETIRREIVGPYGNNEEFSYRNGELRAHVLYSYDEHGHMIDWLMLDGAGNQQGRTIVRTNSEQFQPESPVYHTKLYLHIVALHAMLLLVVCPVYNFTDQPPSFFPWAGWIRV
jgi:hypothetical protein